MNKKAFTTRRLACAYYFACPGLTYGILTSRLPALKSQTGADDGQIGLLLLCLGLSSLAALLSSNALIARFGSRKVLCLSALVMVAGACLCCLAGKPLLLGVFCIVTGFGMGLADVSMNTQGIQLEKRWNASCLSSMHAAYSLGGVCGSLTGAAFAAFSLAPIVQAASVLGAYTCLAPWAGRRLLKDAGNSERKSRVRPGLRPVPLFVLLCGGMSMLAYATEGSVAEWGSLLLHESRGGFGAGFRARFRHVFAGNGFLPAVRGQAALSFWRFLPCSGRIAPGVLRACGCSALARPVCLPDRVHLHGHRCVAHRADTVQPCGFAPRSQSARGQRRGRHSFLQRPAVFPAISGISGAKGGIAPRPADRPCGLRAAGGRIFRPEERERTRGKPPISSARRNAVSFRPAALRQAGS